jgi:hypothetical protein
MTIRHSCRSFLGFISGVVPVQGVEFFRVWFSKTLTAKGAKNRREGREEKPAELGSGSDAKILELRAQGPAVLTIYTLQRLFISISLSVGGEPTQEQAGGQRLQRRQILTAGVSQ